MGPVDTPPAGLVGVQVDEPDNAAEPDKAKDVSSAESKLGC